VLKTKDMQKDFWGEPKKEKKNFPCKIKSCQKDVQAQAKKGSSQTGR